jgi:hypothetical protein
MAGTTGVSGGNNGVGTYATFYTPVGIAYDGVGNLFVSEYGSHIIRSISILSAMVTTLAGTYSISGTINGVGTFASFNLPYGLVYISGYLYISDCSNHLIRRIDISPGLVTTITGSVGSAGGSNGIGTFATFNGPTGITYDGSGNLFVANYNGYEVRSINIVSGIVNTIAGLYNSQGSNNGVGTFAAFNILEGITFVNGMLYLSDSGNKLVRSIYLYSKPSSQPTSQPSLQVSVLNVAAIT